ncbi:hypothetical protein K9L16_03090 [Candidatus Pacearchaeota archaeon]|nr:hypothetical protein [Candidatus Pacearchaeota archaeon]
MATSKKGLEILAIPGGESKWRQPRLIAAVKERRNKKFDKIYEMQGIDSEEDILLLGERLNSGDRVTFDTFPTHYKEYLELANKAQRDGKFPKEVKLRNLKINEDSQSKLYGILGLLEEKIKRRPLAYVKDRKENYLPKIKKFVHKFI